MEWAILGKRYGLLKPFDFRVAIPFLLNTLELLVVLVVCLVLYATGGLYIGTYRFYFFIYILAFLLIGAASSRFALLSFALLCWCTIELALALSSATVESYGVDLALFPPNDFPYPPDTEWVYHPLLRHVPKPNWRDTQRFDVRPEEQARDPAFNWSLIKGADFTVSINSFGLRGPQLTTNDLSKELIFLYGGSTTYDLTVTQGKTWAERLQSDLNNKFTVVNFGMPGYSTTENLIHTVFYQRIVGKLPVCAIYYVGANDIRSAYLEHRDRAYGDYHLLDQGVRKPDLWAAPYSPITRLFNGLAKRRFDSVPEPHQVTSKAVRGRDERLEDIFSEHISTIAAVNKSRGIRTIFVAQMLNRELMAKYGGKEGGGGWWIIINNRDAWPLQEHFNELLKRTAEANGAKFIDPGIDNFRNSDFVDYAHFSADGSLKFAKRIVDDVRNYCE